MNIFNQKKPNENKGSESELKLKPWQICCLFVCLILMVLGSVLFMLGSVRGTRAQDYTVKHLKPTALTGDISIVPRGDKVYVFSENQASVNVFGTEGSFAYSIRVPIYQNGQGCFYFENDEMFVLDRENTLYKYSSEGKFLGKISLVYPENDNNTLLQMTDGNNTLIKTLSIKPKRTIWDIMYFDDEIIQYYAFAGIEDKAIIVTVRIADDEE